MNVFAEIKTLVLDCLAQMQDAGDLPSALDFTPITVEPPRDKLHGDMATNAALVLGKACGQNPRELADKLATRLRDDDRIANIDIAGPGFLNLHLNTPIWHEFLTALLHDGADFGRSDLGTGQKVNVEYVSANPTGPLHIGHTRGAVFGDALANLLAFVGYDVTREYYINDGGAQVDVLVRSIYPHYEKACGVDVKFVNDEDLYPGEYVQEAAKSLAKKYKPQFIGGLSPEQRETFRVHAVNEMMELIRADLAMLGIKMDVFFSEKSLYDTGKIEQAIEALRGKGLIYQGTLPPPKGKQLEDWEAREQTLFKSTDYGDDVDRPIQKFDGSWTYFAPDIAYHYDKLNRGYDRLINIFGADHGGYIKRMKAAVSALSNRKIDFDIKTVQLVKLLKNGEPYKMSKRAGTFVKLSDLLEQVDAGVVRFTMLTRKNDAPLDFDFEKVLEESKDNPVYYVQYAHARVKSVFRKAEKDIGMKRTLHDLVSTAPIKGAVNFMQTPKVSLYENNKVMLSKDFSMLTHEAEIGLIKKLSEWPRLVELSAIHNEPHRIAFYLYDLASALHSFWHLGKDDASLRVLEQENSAHDNPRTLARLDLLKAVETTLTCGLGILGVTPMDEL